MKTKIINDRIASVVMLFCTSVLVLLVFAICGGLIVKSQPLLSENSFWELISSSAWKPSEGEFGFLPFIMGTLWVTALAIVWTLPLALLTSLFLTEIAPKWLRKIVFPLLDILAGIPSVVFGVWGIVVVVPWVSEWLAPKFVDYSTGYTMLSAGVVLGLMVLPLMASLFIELFSTTPQRLREASLSLGATTWQTTRSVVLKKNTPGIIAVVILSISRAMGETIAVLMVCGNIVQIPQSPLDGGYPIPALIANNYGEMMSIPMYDSALMFAALLLFAIVLVFNLISRVILKRIENKYN